MGSSKRNLLTSILLLVVMGVFAVLTIFIVVDAINKKYYNDIKVEYEVQEESPNVILTFARNEGSNFSTDNTKVVLNEDKTKFRIDGTVPTIENGVVTNLDDLTSSDGREFYFFSTNSSFIDPQEDPENPDFIFSETDSRYYVSTEDNPIWYDVPKSSENLTLYSVFLTPNVHNSDFANAPLLNTSPNVIISHDVVDVPYNAFSDIMAYGQSQGQTGVAKIESVVIPNSTKSINSEVDTNAQIVGGAFAACTTLTNIIIPGSVEYVGGEAFMLCSGLDTVEYGNGYYLPTENNEHAILIDTNLKAEDVTIHADCISIQGGTFSKFIFIVLGLITPGEEESEEDYINMNLQEVTIPKNVKNIGMGAFMACMGLENVVFEDNSNLTSIGVYSFMGCSSLKTINLEATKLEEIGAVAFASMNDSMLMLIEEITLPSTLKTIGENAFRYCGSLKTVNFEDNTQLTSIGERAFSYCSSLTSITIPDSVTSIGNYAFRYCSSLETVTFGENSQLTSIGDYTFEGCSNLTSITIPDSVTSIGRSAFYDCTSLTSITIPDSVTSIGGSAFYNCTGLTSITLENMTGLTSIGIYIFDGCDNVKELIIQSGEVKDLDFYYLSNLTTVTLGDSVTSIGRSAFAYCSSLASITIPESVTSIGRYAFESCTSLTSITIPDSVTSIEGYAFRNCIGLISITFEDMTGLTNIGTYIFEGCDNVKQLTIQSGEVKDLDFSDLSNLTTVTLGDGVTSIGSSAFSRCSSLETVTFGENSQLTSIGSSAFRYCSNLTSIIIPESVTSIGRYAFSDCSNLGTVTFGENSQLTSIGNYAFSDCSNLGTVTFGENSQLMSIGSSAFYYCSSLSSITIPSSVTSIGDYAFYNCYDLTSITIPESVTSIGRYAFYRCLNLTSIKIPEGVTSIGDYTFYDCSSLTSITIPDSVTSIGDQAFSGCSSLTSITIPESVTSIGRYAFYDCRNLTSITIPKSVTSIGDYAFRYCYKLVEVYDLTGSDGLNITVGSSDNGYVGYYADYVYTDTNTPLVQKEVNNDYIFYYNAGVMSLLGYTGSEKELTLPSIDKVKELFKDFSGDTYEIYEYAFYENTNITSVVIPNCVTSIGNYAFYSCDSLTSITIPDSVTSIGRSAFYYCNITSITIPDSVTSIGDDAFRSCYKLTIYCEAESQPSGWSSNWNYSDRSVYWAGEWECDEVTGEPVPIESGVEGVGYSDVGEDFDIGFDGLGFREEIYFNDKRERNVV